MSLEIKHKSSEIGECHDYDFSYLGYSQSKTIRLFQKNKATTQRHLEASLEHHLIDRRGQVAQKLFSFYYKEEGKYLVTVL